MLNKVLAILKKDLLLESSYKLAFILNVFSVLSVLVVYYFIDRLFGNTITSHLKTFGVDYFSYVLLSMAFFSYIGVGLGSFSSRVRDEQLQGTLESVLLTPTGKATILTGMVLWNFLIATLDLVMYILAGVFIFGVDFSNVNILSISVIFVLTVLSFSSLGVISASFVLVMKKGNPLGWFLNNIGGLVGGVYYPVSVMPGWLRTVSDFFPVTYAIRAAELAVYRGYSLYELRSELLFLSLLTAVLVPLGGRAFSIALDRCRRRGTLSQF